MTQNQGPMPKISQKRYGHIEWVLLSIHLFISPNMGPRGHLHL